MNFRRCSSFVVALCVACSVVFLNGAKVSAADANQGGWIEFLEQTSVQSNGENWMEISGTSTVVSIPLQSEHRLVRLEMLVWHQTADYPSAVSITANGSTRNLQIVRIDNNLSRIFGEIPTSYYETINIKFSKPTTGKAVWELLSLKCSPIAKATYNADAEVWCREDNNYVECPGTLQYYGQGDGQTVEAQFPVIVYDWRKYDSIIVTGSVSYMGLNSVRASIGNLGLPYEMTYTSTNATGSWNSILTHEDIFHYESDGYGYSSSESILEGDINEEMLYNGKVLYNITVDLTGVDRSMTQDLNIYFTGVINGNYGYMVQVVGVVGTVDTADTSNLSWWARFEKLMVSLFGGSSDSSAAMESVTQQSQDLAEDRLGAVAQAGAVIDDIAGTFQNHGVMDTIAFPALTIKFGDVPWTFGGWDVPVIPPGFESLVESLKLLIDIIATLSFVQAMRHRLEKLLVGGNA